jgi:hypothetical protein
MKAWETILFALALIGVPALAWFAGRAMGRRDWRIQAVIVTSVFVTLIPNLLRLIVLAMADTRGFDVAAPAQMYRALDTPEVAFFFLALGGFMTILGWTSTPVAARD